MLLWVILAVLTAAALGAILFPLSRKYDREGETRSDYDSSVYKDQLQEIDADLERGLISEVDAQTARVEVSRRLLASAEPAKGSDSETESAGFSHSTRQTIALGVSAVLVPILSLGLYLTYGSPGMPDLPRSARIKEAPENQRIDELIARVEDRLRKNPADGKGWEVIAPTYLRLGRYDEAVEAFTNSIKYLGETKERLFGAGEALRLANNGIVNDRALSFFEGSVKIDPDYVPSLYRLALAKEQDGRFDQAVELWKTIVSKVPVGDDWRKDAERRLVVAEAKANGRPVPPPVAQAQEQAPTTGPNQEQIEAARNMSPEQRMAMINQMVSGLAERLKKNGNDAKGWVRLVQAYAVLGRRTLAVQALKDARSNLSENSEALSQLDVLAKRFGLDG